MKYPTLEQALFDLKLFSGMNMNAERPLYVWQGILGGDFCIDPLAPFDTDRVVAIGLNGLIFERKK